MLATATEQETLWRVNNYRLLARLFARPVDQDLLALLVQDITDDTENNLTILKAWNNVVHAVGESTLEQLAEQYHDLFIGMTRGELLPYGSFYQTGFLMEKPLAILREDLHKLGFQRQAEVCEPEDHITALCEVMSVLAQENRAEQNDFFNRHLNNWVGTFFDDLASTQSSVFYRAVAAFGSAFFAIEITHLTK